jgi:hypothetical protein
VTIHDVVVRVPSMAEPLFTVRDVRDGDENLTTPPRFATVSWSVSGIAIVDRGPGQVAQIADGGALPVRIPTAFVSAGTAERSPAKAVPIIARRAPEFASARHGTFRISKGDANGRSREYNGLATVSRKRSA